MLVIDDERDLREWTSGHINATIVAMTTEPLRAVRDHLSEVIDRVEHSDTYPQAIVDQPSLRLRPSSEEKQW